MLTHECGRIAELHRQVLSSGVGPRYHGHCTVGWPNVFESDPERDRGWLINWPIGHILVPGNNTGTRSLGYNIVLHKENLAASE
jgi:hypothetical protein